MLDCILLVAIANGVSRVEWKLEHGRENVAR
jgi:hypothetical protein